MNSILKKLLLAGKTVALDSPEQLVAEARKMGIPEEEIDEALKNPNVFPLDEEMLAQVAGGVEVLTLTAGKNPLRPNMN